MYTIKICRDKQNSFQVYKVVNSEEEVNKEVDILKQEKNMLIIAEKKENKI